ncbi:MAG: hypothetical protein QF662_04185, partial [Phycisphaerae bacterium]|nr:hypothetical protein [Phycisphaerae bacterium]
RFLVEGFDIHEDIEGGRLAGRIVLRSAEPWGTIKAPRPAAIGQTKYLQGLEARGDFHVTDAKLYRLPVVMKMLSLLQLGAGEKTAFHEVSAKFFLRKGRFILEDIQLVGSSLSLHGAGSIEPGGKLRLSFLTGRKQTKPFAPVLSELMAGLRKEIVVVEVTGTLKKPKVQMRSLTELTAPMRELLNLIREQRAATNRKKGK